MFNNLRLTDSANTALQNAGGVALQFGSYSIDSEHILYGLTAISDSVSSKILSNYGVTRTLSQALEPSLVMSSEWESA